MASMAVRVLLVRHGATALSAEDRFCGRTDPPLSDEGERQARAAAARLAGEGFAGAYTSPQARAVRTAELIIGGGGRPVRLVREAGLREIDHGRWEGLRQDEVKSRFGEEHRRWSADPLTFAPEGGETGLSVLSRALPVLRRIVEEHSSAGGGAVLVVSHKATIRLLAAAVLGLDPRRYRDRLASDFAGVSVIGFKGFDRARLERWNEVAWAAGAAPHSP
jgi:probable phosphoglycerate mutase